MSSSRSGLSRQSSEWALDSTKIILGRRLAVGGFAEVFVGKYEVRRCVGVLVNLLCACYPCLYSKQQQVNVVELRCLIWYCLHLHWLWQYCCVIVCGFVFEFLFHFWIVQGTVVAVKRLMTTDAATIERFVREIRLLARLRHPNLILFMGYCIAPELCIVQVKNGCLK